MISRDWGFGVVILHVVTGVLRGVYPPYLTDGWISRGIHVRWSVILVLFEFACIALHQSYQSYYYGIFYIWRLEFERWTSIIITCMMFSLKLLSLNSCKMVPVRGKIDGFCPIIRRFRDPFLIGGGNTGCMVRSIFYNCIVPVSYSPKSV